MARFKILLVDDDESIRDYTACVLEEAGFAVWIAASAEEAEAVLRAGEAIDLLIADVVLPKRTGVELARIFSELRPGGRVLFTTGYTRHIEPESLASAEILEKPYNRAALLHNVQLVLAQAEASIRS